MTSEQLANLLGAIASLIQALGWPLLVLFLVLYFGAPIKKFLSDMGEFTFKAGASGLEASAKRQQIEAAALLGAATASKQGESSVSKLTEMGQAQEIAKVVTRSITPRGVRRLSEALVLWVDDNPLNNLYEQKALEALGIKITTSISTDDALKKLRLDRYDVIISDMGRPPDKQAGYTLLAELQKMRNAPPFIIYAGSNAPEHKVEARQKGAIGSTNNPQELFQLVLGAIEDQRL